MRHGAVDSAEYLWLQSCGVSLRKMFMRFNQRQQESERGNKVRKSIVIAMTVMMAAVLVAGCTTGSGASDKDQIAGVLNEWKAGFEAGSIDAIMAPVSESFTHYEWTNKAALQAFVKGALDQGELNNAEIDLQYAEYKKNDDGTWTVYPIELTAVFGSATIEGTFKQEESGWKIVGIEVEGI